MIGNLIVKVVTAPFALLSGGGGADLSVVEFRPGTPVMADEPAPRSTRWPRRWPSGRALQMTVTGAADPVSEREAIRAGHRSSSGCRRAAPRGAARRRGAPAAPKRSLRRASASDCCKEVYRDADLPDKPRNVIGLAKDIPAAEMEALLKQAHARQPKTTARQLALQRGLAVRDALVAKGLPSERLFLAAPKLRASGEDDAAWTPRAQLSLAVK